jgi:hypothetical protein
VKSGEENECYIVILSTGGVAEPNGLDQDFFRGNPLYKLHIIGRVCRINIEA